MNSKNPEMHDCECGFLWRHGQSGDHSCGPYYRHTIAELRAAAAPQVVADERAATPAATWRVNGEPDPHGMHYDGERAALCMGNLTDDELANAAFMNYDANPSIADMLAGKAFRPIVYMTAVKERIRWLSRALVKATGAASIPVQPVAVPDDSKAVAWLCTDLDGHCDVGVTRDAAALRAGRSCNHFIPLFDNAAPVSPVAVPDAFMLEHAGAEYSNLFFQRVNAVRYVKDNDMAAKIVPLFRAAPAAQGDAETLQKVRDAVEQFKVEWMRVPYFAHRVNKAVRDQIGTATSIVVNIPCIIDAAIAAKAAS